ncbi:hypothetical protein BGZ83_010266 [Gryganskiella cystojenkinii]|nr:hypothetical protein BGZ83_010266 [Gryganskiella cystojenkinii]
MNTLIRTIHSNEHQFQAAWLNAILGRMFLGVYKTPQIKDMVFQKMVEKLSRVRLPNFLNDMRMKSVHLGDGVPLITRPKLLTLKPNGDMIMDLSLLYQGGFRAEVEAEAVVTVTKKIQPIKVSLVLVMTLIRLEGRVQVWVKPPPCNRIWYGFYHKPHVEMKIEPVVSDKHITSNLIIKAIENKMLEAIAETMVLPNMDDIPFSDSDGIGGIFGEEISPGGATEIPTTSASSTKSGPKSLPKRSHSPGPRSATINLADGAHNHPRTAIEIPHDLRHRADTMYMTAPAMYQNPNGARSHASLGDELMQTNYTYDSQNRRLNLEEDPMRVTATAGAGQEELITGHMSTSPEAIPSTKTLRVPGGCGIVVDNDIGSPSQGYDSSASNNTNNSNTTSTNRLLQRKAAASNNHGRRGSLDPGMNLSYTTGASNPSSTANSFQPQGTENVRTMEEHWSHYGIHEYEPAPPEGGKGLTSKERKKLKVSKNSGDKSGNNMVDGDRASVHSKDSGDTNSTHTGTTRWTENSGQSLLGNSSQSTLDASGASSLYSPSAKSDKFSLSKMFQGFRKKHTKGVHSGSSFQLQNSSTDGLGRYPGEGDSGSILLEEDEDVHLGEEMSYNDHLHPLSGGGSRIPGGQGEQGDLLNAYSPQFRQKFESTPNLSTALYSTEPDLVAPIQQDGSGLLGYEEYELMHERREGSPVSSVYASSLFGDDSPVDQNHKNGSNKSPTNSNSNNNNNSNHHHLLLNFSPKFGTALRKLRNRSHGGSGSSKEELHIPTGDLHEVLRRHQQQQQQLQQQQIEPGRLSASENTSQYALYNGGHESSSPSQTVPNSSTSTSSGASRGVGGETQEDEQFPNGMVPGTFISTAAYNGGAPSSGGRTPDLVDPSQPGIVRAFHAAPQIVLQQPSPHLSQGSSEGLPPLFSDSRQESPQLQQYLPEKQPLRQQPIPTTNLRVERNLVVNGVTPVGSPSSLVKGRPRRHSINHPPSIAPNSGSGSSSGSNGGHGLHFPHLHIHGLGVSPASPLRREFSRQDSDDPYTGTGSPVRSPRIAQSPQAPLAPSPLPSPPPPRPSSTPPVPPPLNLATSALPPASSSSPSFVTENESRGSSTGGRTRNNSDTFSLASTASSSLSVSGGGGRESTATTPTSGHQHGNAFRNMLSNLKNKKKSSNSSSTHSSTSPSPTRTPTTATMSHLHEHIYEEHTSSQIPQFPTLAMDSHMLQGPQMQQELEQQQRQQQTTTTTTTAAAAAIDATTA